MSRELSIAITWLFLLIPIPLILGTWYAFVRNPPRRLSRTTRVAVAVLTVAYLVLLLELVAPQIIGEHYGDRRAFTILVGFACSVFTFVVGILSRGSAGLSLSISSAIVGSDWAYMGVIGTAV